MHQWDLNLFENNLEKGHFTPTDAKCLRLENDPSQNLIRIYQVITI